MIDNEYSIYKLYDCECTLETIMYLGTLKILHPEWFMAFSIISFN